MTSPTPKVSVIMPVYNTGQFVKAAIRSILLQTHHDFELIIVNDGSTDDSLEAIQSFSDRRIKIINFTENKGISTARNYAINAAQGMYIAHMDSDDISHPERLADQVAYMENNPHTGICGTWAKLFGERNGIAKSPTSNAEIKCRLLFNCIIYQPTVMIRKSILLDNKLLYNPDFITTEDYDLWARGTAHTNFGCIPKVLLDYRTHHGQITSNDSITRRKRFLKRIYLYQIERLGFTPTQEEIDTHEAIANWEIHTSKSFVMSALKWLDKLHSLNIISRIYDQTTLDRVLSSYMYGICLINGKHGMWTWKQFYRSSLIQSSYFSNNKKLFLLLKCLLKR